MMGVGKSTIGKILAKKLQYDFLDIDRLIEQKEGSSINLIFKNKGEEYFREIEKKLTLSELKKINCVISLGGGSFLQNEVRKSVKKLSGPSSTPFKLYSCASTILIPIVQAPIEAKTG